MVITTFQTVASEHKAYLDSGAAEKATQKKIASDSDSDSDSFAKKTLRKGKKGKAMTALFDVKWLRIVVGESVDAFLLGSSLTRQMRLKISRIDRRKRPKRRQLSRQSTDGV